MHAYTHMHPCTYTYTIHTHTYSHAYKYIHACIHTHAHACTHTLTDMHTYIPNALCLSKLKSKPSPGPWTYLYILFETQIDFSLLRLFKPGCLAQMKCQQNSPWRRQYGPIKLNKHVSPPQIIIPLLIAASKVHPPRGIRILSRTKPFLALRLAFARLSFFPDHRAAWRCSVTCATFALPDENSSARRRRFTSGCGHKFSFSIHGNGIGDSDSRTRLDVFSA